MISRETDSDLQNWGRWCNQGPLPHPLPQSRAASAEGRYIAEAGDVWDDPPAKPAPVDVQRALIVQRVYDHLLSHSERKVLQAEYPHKDRYIVFDKRGRKYFDRAMAARRQGTPLRVYEAALRKAAWAVELELRTVE